MGLVLRGVAFAHMWKEPNQCLGVSSLTRGLLLRLLEAAPWLTIFNREERDLGKIQKQLIIFKLFVAIY